MSVFLKNIMDYPYMEDFIDFYAIFRAYDKGDDCVMFAIVAIEEHFQDDDFPLTLESIGVEKLSPYAELCIYGYQDSFFDINKVSDLVTDPSGCITIQQPQYMSDKELYVYNPEYNKEQGI